MASIPWLADALRAAGLTVVEHAGWKSRTVGGSWSPQYGIVHATAAPRAQSDADQVRIVRDGRTGLRGPIGNACVDRKGRWHVLAAGRCNTTVVGTAGPYRGKGNTNALGVEACNDNGLRKPAEPWPDVQYQAYALGWAVICRKLGWAPARLRGHKEHTPGHKTDPTFSMPTFRARVGDYMRQLDKPKTEDFMASIEDLMAFDLGTRYDRPRYSFGGAVLDGAVRSAYLANVFAPSVLSAVTAIGDGIAVLQATIAAGNAADSTVAEDLRQRIEQASNDLREAIDGIPAAVEAELADGVPAGTPDPGTPDPDDA